MRAQWINLLLLGFALAYSYYAYQLNPGVITDPGPGFFPRILGTGMIAVILVIIGMEFLSQRRLRTAGKATEVALLPGKNALLFAAGLLAYMLLLPFAGYPAATLLALIYLMRLMGEKRWVVILGLALLLTTLFYMVFSNLQVPLPPGVLGFDSILNRAGN
ncbi:MAG: tripartite tricarboxylate transporter TctB family protein [Chloroflexota bacterium]